MTPELLLETKPQVPTDATVGADRGAAIASVDWKALHRSLCRKDAVNADDAVQDVRLAILRGRFDRYRLAELRPIVWKSAHNALISIERRTRRCVAWDEVESAISGSSLASVAFDADDAIDVEFVTSKLATEDVRLVELLRQDLDQAEVGQLVELSRDQLYRQRESLRRAFAHLDPRRPSRRAK